MDPEVQALSTPTPPIPPEAQALPTPAPTPGASSSAIQTIQANPKVLQSAMKTPTDGIEKLQKPGSESLKGSLRFLLPGPVFCVGEVGVGDEEEGNGSRVGCGEEGCSSDDDDDDDEEVSERSLLGSRRGIERRKRRWIGKRGCGNSVGARGTREGWWRDWRGALALWVVIIVLGSAMAFVFVENAEDEGPMPGDSGQGSSEGKRFFSLMSIMGWGSEKQEVGSMALDDSMKLMERGVDFLEVLELELDLHKREVPDDAKWLYDAQDPSYDLVPDNATDRDKLIESQNGAVSSDVEICSETGVGLMKRGGNAVDAVIGEFLVLNFRAHPRAIRLPLNDG